MGSFLPVFTSTAWFNILSSNLLTRRQHCMRSPHTHTQGATPEPTEKGVGAWPFILISVILVLSISFEILKESVEHHTPKVRAYMSMCIHSFSVHR